MGSEEGELQSLPWSLLFQSDQEGLVHPGDLEGLGVPAHPWAQSRQLDPGKNQSEKTG